jgi:hypothetical protein
MVLLVLWQQLPVCQKNRSLQQQRGSTETWRHPEKIPLVFSPPGQTKGKVLHLRSSLHSVRRQIKPAMQEASFEASASNYGHQGIVEGNRC